MKRRLGLTHGRPLSMPGAEHLCQIGAPVDPEADDAPPGSD